MTVERPILFSGAMVRAILDGSKTVTRRVCPVQPSLVDGLWNALYPWGEGGHGIYETEAELREEYDRLMLAHCPYGRAGDRLWVRETWAPDPPIDDTWASTEWNGCGRRAADVVEHYRKPEFCLYAASWTGADLRWVPSIHMYRWASRITLEVTGVAVERLQDITEEQAKAEGVPNQRLAKAWLGIRPREVTSVVQCSHREAFEHLWNDINGKRPGCSWADNPWVWAVSFKRIEVATPSPQLPPALRHMDGCCE